ncbi:MAG: glycosyltransferase family 2 protein [Dehalococcoidales bacterium]|jgi:glycosyltransferase involved in cell wall biosynthesis|nr:glycosyltransferase family 2 protein [Dehalococcoidales bacterium]MDD5402148.1 glycosyltransferase family 2 protein [Dehalococcoidales bacterium]
MPEFVDRIYVINDASTDRTEEIAATLARSNNKVKVISHKRNRGVGGAITTGHSLVLKDKSDVAAIMAGDNQMAPEYLSGLLEPVVNGIADYAKGDRMSCPEHNETMPRFRRFGTRLLTILTRISSGYWHINDPQNGYTVISATALSKIPLHRLNSGYAFENDMLVHLNLIGAKVMDVSHPAVYNGQCSCICYPRFVVKTSWILLKRWIWRLWKKYVAARYSKQ